MDLGSGKHKNSMQMELPLGRGGEAPSKQWSCESNPAVDGNERSGTSHRLMEEVVESRNVKEALKRVRKNKGSPGIDGMTIEELPAYMASHWAALREQLLAGTYQPRPVKRQQIPKPGGGVRELGIPTVLDRVIQQAILQVLQPRFDPTFSKHSYGFRPGRSAHEAVLAAQKYIQGGRGWVVDVDLEKFFDRVNHDVLMGRLAKRIEDKRMLRVIRGYLAAGVMVDGLAVERHEGTPQGGPLSPILANVLLDEVDKELERRGHAFCRYADDSNVYVRSKRAGERVMEGLRKLYGRLRLKVNETKSAVAPATAGRKFLGYRFLKTRDGRTKRAVAHQTLGTMKDRIRQITRRPGGRSMKQVLTEISRYLRGWKNFFRLAETPKILDRLDSWIRRRLRAVQLKQWSHGKRVLSKLLALGVPERQARLVAAHSRRYWSMSKQSAMHIAFPPDYYDRMGVPRLAT